MDAVLLSRKIGVMKGVYFKLQRAHVVMIAHCTAAALVSENKGLCHPASVDSISTLAAQEDHTFMGGWAARKCGRVVAHIEQVLAIELLCAAQAVDFLRPLRSTPALERVRTAVRACVQPCDCDRYMASDIDAAHALLKSDAVWAAAKTRSSTRLCCRPAARAVLATALLRALRPPRVWKPRRAL